MLFRSAEAAPRLLLGVVMAVVLVLAVLQVVFRIAAAPTSVRAHDATRVGATAQRADAASLARADAPAR